MGYGTYGDAMNALERALSQSDYIVGDSFTAADGGIELTDWMGRAVRHDRKASRF